MKLQTILYQTCVLLITVTSQTTANPIAGLGNEAPATAASEHGTPLIAEREAQVGLPGGGLGKPGVGHCRVNARELDVWHEQGLQRRRIAFSAEGTKVDNYCKIFQEARYDYASICVLPHSNYQCYYNTVVKSWVIDVNFALGLQGDDGFFKCLTGSRSRWISYYGCETG